jgi:hypothetical protein
LNKEGKIVIEQEIWKTETVGSWIFNTLVVSPAGWLKRQVFGEGDETLGKQTLLFSSVVDVRSIQLVRYLSNLLESRAEDTAATPRV